MVNRVRNNVPRKLVQRQLIVAVLITILWWLLGGHELALAAAFGGMIAVVTNLYFAVRSFSLGPGATPLQRMRAVFRAEVIKLLLAAFLFAVAAHYFSEHYVVLISAWFATTAVYFVALRW